MRNEELISILKEMYPDIKDISKPINMHNTWHGANDFAQGKSNSYIFNLAVLLNWFSINDPDKFIDFYRRITSTLDEENRDKLNDDLYSLRLRNLDLNTLVNLEQLAQQDTNTYGTGNIAIDISIRNLWTSPDNIKMHPSTAQQFAEAIPQILLMSETGFKRIEPSTFSIFFIDPFHPRVPFLEGYIDGRKESVMHRIQSLLQVPRIAIAVFKKAMDDADGNEEWQALIERFVSRDKIEEYNKIVKHMQEAEHVFMQESKMINDKYPGKDTDIQIRRDWLKAYLSLARKIYFDYSEEDTHIDHFIIPLLRSEMSGGFQYKSDDRDIKEFSPQEIKLILTKPKENEQEFNRFLDSLNVEAIATAKRSRKP
jgi:hypothetical protein